ncbi:ABC transporter [Streptomyces iconiensis]|uniref:ABC transporter n=1 Tax=Streptomyces iconiensis TaxID=1384038 RepID=A0ABT7A0I7_9ACTN|nr:ABC transporter [Streptomyces iconiensis]MDJ1134840.1 ABC transporter [Streptomyces iconiensis]
MLSRTVAPGAPPSRWLLATALLRPELRAARLWPLLYAGTAGLLLCAGPAVSGAEVRPPAAVLLARLASVLCAVGLAMATDDPAARSTRAVPVPRWLPRGVRVLGVGAIAAAFWGVSLACLVQGVEGAARAAVPVGGLAVEAAALACLALTLGLLGMRVTQDATGSLVAAPGVVLLTLTLVFLPPDVGLFLDPGSPDWAASRWRWATLLSLTCACAPALLRDQYRSRH